MMFSILKKRIYLLILLQLHKTEEAIVTTKNLKLILSVQIEW